MIAIAFLCPDKKTTMRKWLRNPIEKLSVDLAVLIGRGLVSKKNFDGQEYIYIQDYYIKAVEELWNAAGSRAFEIFPSEAGIPYPPDAGLIQIVTEIEIRKFLDNPPDSNLPLIRIALGESGSIITLASFLRTKLLDAALLKIKAFTNEPQCNDYIHEEMNRLLPGCEAPIETSLGMLRKEIAATARALTENHSQTYRFWICLCKLIRNYPNAIRRTFKIMTPFLQAVDVVEIYNAYYHEKSLTSDGENSIIGQIESQMSNPPYFFTMEDISKFTDKYGKMFAEIIPRSDLAAVVKKRTESGGSKLAGILAFRGTKNEHLYVEKKSILKALLYRASKISAPIAESIRAEWRAILRNYHSVLSMYNDTNFEILVTQKVKESDPFIVTCYLDPRLNNLRSDISQIKASSGDAEFIFKGGVMAPLRKILKLERDVLYTEALRGLPLWYRLPFVIFFIRFLGRIHD
jgi:hypothetical protein